MPPILNLKNVLQEEKRQIEDEKGIPVTSGPDDEAASVATAQPSKHRVHMIPAPKTNQC